MKITNLMLDLAAIEGGHWVENIPGLADVRILTKGVGNAAFRALNSQLVKALVRDGKAGAELTTEQAEEIEAQLLLKTCLLDWENLTNDDGTPLPFSSEKAELFLTNPTYRPIRTGIAYAAQQVGARVAAQVEADRKN